jgi:putative acetyltransferase
MINIRPEQPEDIPLIHAVNEVAFGQSTEANLVDALRSACPDVLSLVAVSGGQIVGHILFTPVIVSDSPHKVKGMGLAPMAVLPEYQHQGIGSLLVEAGLRILGTRKCPFVIVLGHTDYSPRFGFVPASRHGLDCQWDAVPDEAFMALVLDETIMSGVSGMVRYREEFDEAV